MTTYGGGTASDVIWKWNETDLLEFTAPATPNIGNSFGTAPTIAYVASGHRGIPVIECTNPAAAAFGGAGWSIDPANFSEALPTRFILEYFLEQIHTPNVGFHFGPMLFCDEVDTGAGYGLFRSANNMIPVRFAAAGPTVLGGTPPHLQVGVDGTNDDQGIWVRCEVLFAQGSPPTWFVNTQEHYGLNGAGGNSYHNTPGNLDWGALEADFNAWAPTTIGLVARGNGAAADDTAQISSIILRKHPMDV